MRRNINAALKGPDTQYVSPDALIIELREDSGGAPGRHRHEDGH